MRGKNLQPPPVASGEDCSSLLRLTKLEIPYYYDGCELTSILLMSWAGASLASLMRSAERYAQISGSCGPLIKDAIRTTERHQVVHGDAEPRNFLYDEQSNRLMIVEFERSNILPRQPLGELSPIRKRLPTIDVVSPRRKDSRAEVRVGGAFAA